MPSQRKPSKKAAEVPPILDEKDAEIARLLALVAAANKANGEIPERAAMVENITPNPLKFYVVTPKGETEEFRFGPMPIPNKGNPLAPPQQIEGDTPYRLRLPPWALKDPMIRGALKGNPSKGFDPQLRLMAA